MKTIIQDSTIPHVFKKAPIYDQLTHFSRKGLVIITAQLKAKNYHILNKKSIFIFFGNY